MKPNPLFSSCFLILSATLLSLSMAHSKDDLEPWPAPEDGFKRWVIQLPALDGEQEASRKVELIVGKTVEVDPVNRFFFGGELEQETLQGWGYTFYKLSKPGPMAGTLMAAPEGAAKVKRFVALGGEPKLVRYNSKLPLVVYLPEGWQLKYRLWSAGETDEAEAK